MIAKQCSLAVLFAFVAASFLVFQATLSDGTVLVSQLNEKYGNSSGIDARGLQALIDKLSKCAKKRSKQDFSEAQQLMIANGLSVESVINESELIRLSPRILSHLERQNCEELESSYQTAVTATQLDATGEVKVVNASRSYSITDIKPQVWIASIISIFIISVAGLLGVAMVPLVQKFFYNHLIQFLVALAVGSLTGDAFLHLLPHAIVASVVEESGIQHKHDERQTVYKGLIALGGVYFFYMAEKMLALISEHRAQRKAEQASSTPNYSTHSFESCEKSEAALLEEKRRLRSAVRTSGGSSGRRISQALSTSCDEILTVGLGSKAMKSIDTLKRLAQSESDLDDSEEHRPRRVKIVLPNGNSSSAQEFYPGTAEAHTSDLLLNPKLTCPDQCDAMVLPDHMRRGQLLRQKSTEKHTNGTSDEEAEDLSLENPEKHGHGHSHEVPESIASVAWMVILGDGLHNFSDGLAIGAAFAQGVSGGLSTAVAVFCHELPHELGDFAVLLKTGMKVKQALFYNVVSSILCFVGMLIGIALGNVESASYWIFATAGGMFIYISLVDMLPELSSANVKPGESRIIHFLVQNLGIATGVTIMLIIAFYEDAIKDSLDWNLS